MARLLTTALATALLAGPAMAQPASPEARAFFERWDRNHDGRITWDEAWAEIQRRFATADTSRNGALDEAEWMAAETPGRPPLPNRPPPDPQRQHERRMAMFRGLDADRNGLVTLEEIRPVAEAWFRSFDANGDGALTPEEMPRPRAPRPAR